ncbi:UNVERIFIED_CONTAM: hypothetical protein RMT77_002595 [Armadillidium vulgare]
MGCGRSTMGSDSPSRNSKQDEDWNDGSDSQTFQKETPIHSASANSHPTLPFNHGGALLAQAKISGSQLDFFKVLDEKIESGPDYESEAEEDGLIKKSRLTVYLEEWNQITRAKAKENIVSSSQKGTDNIPLIRSPVCETPSSHNTLDNDCSSSEEDAGDKKQAVKEQYMFMGNLYTLTRFPSDGSYIPRVDVSPAHKPLEDGMEEGTENKETPVTTDAVVSVESSSSEAIETVADIEKQKSPKIMKVLTNEDCVSRKVNGTYTKDEKGRRLHRADTPFHHTVTVNPKDRIPQRPASLVLRTVFPKQEAS